MLLAQDSHLTITRLSQPCYLDRMQRRSGYERTAGRPRQRGAPALLGKQLSVIDPCGQGQIAEAGHGDAGPVLLSLYPLRCGRSSFTSVAGDPGSLG